MIINLVWDREHMTCGGYDITGAGYTITVDRYTPLSRVHCNGCAEAEKLRAELEAARAELEAERRGHRLCAFLDALAPESAAPPKEPK